MKPSACVKKILIQRLLRSFPLTNLWSAPRVFNWTSTDSRKMRFIFVLNKHGGCRSGKRHYPQNFYTSCTQNMPPYIRKLKLGYNIASHITAFLLYWIYTVITQNEAIQMI